MEIRQAASGDNNFLFDMLYQAAYIPDGVEMPPKSIVYEPHIAKYVADFGRAGDVGFVLVDGDERVGAIWSRLFSEENKGFGFVDASTPEMAMSILEGYRNRGFGSQLIARLIGTLRENSWEKLSLAVDKRNPAMRLYKRSGFEVVGEDKNLCVMLREL